MVTNSYKRSNYFCKGCSDYFKGADYDKKEKLCKNCVDKAFDIEREHCEECLGKYQKYDIKGMCYHCSKGE